MYLKTSNKKQLAAAVTLAVMGTAWVAVPGQVWAADGGSQDHPRQYSSYTADSDRAIAIAREQKTGEDMYAAQYHENFADLAFRAKDDMGGKTITLKSMTVEGIIGADGKGAAAGLPVEESTAGKNGGIGSAVGIYSTNILNANITFGDIAIKAIGGNTYSQEITSGKYTHEGKVGVDGASDKNLNGGAGANGGNGGLAIATGVDITGSNNTATGGVLTVTATVSDGGHGGYGGVGGTAAAITTVPAKAGDGAQGADGADSTTSGTTPSTAGANGTIGGAGGDGLAGAGGTAGTVGAVGLTGGIGGNGSNGGSGSNAEATGLKIAGSGTATTISLGGLVVEDLTGAEVRKSARKFLTSDSDWKKQSLTYTRKEGAVEVALSGFYQDVQTDILIRISPAGEMNVSYVVAGQPNGYLRETGLSFYLPERLDYLQWERKGMWSCYPEGAFAGNTGETSLYNPKQVRYGENPAQPWSADTHNYYYWADAGANCDCPLTQMAKGMKENIYRYTLSATGGGAGLTVCSPDASLACRTSKRGDGQLMLYINNRWDYPEIAWGNYCKTLEAVPCYGEMKIRF